MSTNEYIWLDFDEVAKLLAQRTQALRLSKGWKQATLAKRAGVSLASLRRFEQQGKVSLKSLLRIAMTLGRLEEFTKLLLPAKANSVAELEMLASAKKRKRGSK